MFFHVFRNGRVSGARVNMMVETDEESRRKAQDCIEMTKRFCHITNSIEKAVHITMASEVIKS